MEDMEGKIQSQYDQLGYRLGWRFLSCPKENLKKARVALITLNPGGYKFEPPIYSVEQGSAYVVESWKGYPKGKEPLQLQVRRMYELMSENSELVLSAHYVPFRSPDWESLTLKQEALSFARALWSPLLAKSELNTIVTMGEVVTSEVVSILGAHIENTFPAGWGNIKIRVWRTNGTLKLISLPHLSRFKLFNRSVSELSFQRALQAVGV